MNENAQTLIARMLSEDEIVIAKFNTKSGMIEFNLVFNGVTLDELKGIDYSNFSYEDLCSICNNLHEFIAHLHCRKPYQNVESSKSRIWTQRMKYLESALGNAMYERDKKASEENM